MQTYIRVVSAVSRAFGIFSMLLLAAAVLVVSQMIFVRYVLNGSTIWQTEFVIYAVIAATLLGSPAVLIDRGHVGVDLLPEAMHGRGRLVLQIIAGVASLAFCAVLAWSGWVYFHEALTRGWKTATVWALPLWIPLLPMPVGIGLLCLQYVAELMKLANPRLGGRPA
ncbi:TRAP transporter small permease subunit [Microbaculum marinisediminis]|uniref:TRAP transporter small permease protein n=1 Tax=Microbaculum marinisediminis TaxID=2931392 RepID=A0AAW5R4N8_9HYPH|nr:TRAP transporter small permease [Microbaculum sp. A6E488]MCT8974898.1 TRAP transporter small permease [Microbaculum sp. A6E488]